MSESIDELFARWQRNTADADVTATLCDALRNTKRADLVEIVGDHASRQLDVPALLAAARMYEGQNRLDDAQAVLLSAGRLSPRDGEVYRCLGVVLLRRGDAERAEKVLERAVQFGSNGNAGMWLDKARVLVDKQRSNGMIAVAEEVAKISVPEPAPPTASPDVRPSQRLPLPAPAPPPRRPEPSSFDDEVETLIKRSGEVAEALAFAKGDALRPAAGAAPPKIEPLTSNRDNPFMPPSSSAQPAAPLATAAFGTPGVKTEYGTAAVSQEVRPRTEGARPYDPPPSSHVPASRVPASNVPAYAPPAPPINPLLERRVLGADGQRIPEARDVLDALQVAGVFEADGAVRPNPSWDRPEKGRWRIKSYIALTALAAVFIGGGIGIFRYVNDTRAKQHVEAEAILTKIDADLAASDAALLEGAEKDLTRAFDLESRSPHAALAWLRERAMVGLTKGGENIAFEDAAQRAKEVGVSEKQVAFAYVASFLFQGDTGGAASKVAQWDGKADDDPWYQLIAGATFERAGDARAIDRYAAAVRLDPGLVIAHVLRARATAVDGDPRKAQELAKEFRTKFPTRPEGPALVALAWARDPMHGEPPPEVRELLEKSGTLPPSLRAVPDASRAILALESHKQEDAKPALQKGLAAVDTPGMAAWLGGIALGTGDEALARKAALAALSYSAAYAPARVLAARVALLGGRLDEALKAAEELPPTSPDVAVVTAAVAYEKVDGERMTRALDAMSDDAKKLPFMAPLVRGHLLLAGQANAMPEAKALELADGELPWGDLVAMDAALDAGDLDLAEKIATTWRATPGEPRPLRAIRLARLARYQNKLDDADRLSRYALEKGGVTLRSFAERVFVLTAADKDRDAMALFKTYPNLGGTSVKWLRAYAIGNGGGKMEEARVIVSQEDAPSNLTPLPTRIFAAAAYGATKDARHGSEVVRALNGGGFHNNDVTTAAEKLGLAVNRPLRRR